MNRRTQSVLVRAMPAATVLAAGVCLAQYQVNSGRALDANLNVNSGGYNYNTTREAYIQPSPYTINIDTGDFEFNSSNAFAMPRYTWSRMPESYAFWNRPTDPPTGNGNIFQYDRRTGTYKYNTIDAFNPPQYNPINSPPNVYGQGITAVNIAPPVMPWQRRQDSQGGNASTAVPRLGPGPTGQYPSAGVNTAVPASGPSMSPVVAQPRYQVPLGAAPTPTGAYNPL